MPQTPKPTQLSRTTRFSINPDFSMQGENSYAAKPSPSGLARHYEITLGASGIPDPATGYLISIQELDAVVRGPLLEAVSTQCQTDPCVEPGTMIPQLWSIASSSIKPKLSLLRWSLSPYYCLEMNSETAPTRSILFRQRFDFAAAHRLHAPDLSDEDNARFFGKCNNPSGHGHNYQLEPTLLIPADALDGFNAQLAVQRAVNSTLIEHLDHKFLNSDCDWFNQGKGGVIPSIENIARVCFEQLAPAIDEIGHGMKLVTLQAWETEKTSAIYPA